jgi:molybdopterin synthase catalytic subunit
MVHRLGHMELGEVSVVVALSCPHRAEAFAACQYAMDRLKEIVPIWKKEHWADGTTEWVHPQISLDQPRGAP